MREVRIGLDLAKCRNEGEFRVKSFRWLLRHEVNVAEKAVVDLGAGPCQFSRIANAFGARVTAVDGRDDRVPDDVKGQVVRGRKFRFSWPVRSAGAMSAGGRSHEPGNEAIRFIHEDVRNVDIEPFDVVLIFGLLYHFEIDDQIELLQRCKSKTVLIDTMVCRPEFITRYPRQEWECVVESRSGYEGWIYPEKDNPMASIGNRRSFWHTEESYARLFRDCGFGHVTAYRPMYLAENGVRSFFRLMPA